MTLPLVEARDWLRRSDWRDRGDVPAGVEEVVRRVIREVRDDGDAALLRFTREFDQCDLAGPLLTDDEWDRGAAQAAPALVAALGAAHERITAYHQAQHWDRVSAWGPARLLTRPVRSAGLYVPGGRASYPSTVLMSAIPARVAGVEELVLASPPRPDGTLSPGVLAAARLAGVTRVVRCGGAQAVAALAYGTESVPRVDRVVGPGNVYVTLAKHLCLGATGIDGLAGPSEVVVLAGPGADPRQCALGLAAQLEHDPLTWALLVTADRGLAERVVRAFAELLPELDRASLVREAAAGGHAAAVVCDTEAEAVRLTEEFAPEHLQVLLPDPHRWLSQLTCAGAVFVGSHSPVPVGDYAAGPNHTLPTGGRARFAAPLSVHDFLRRQSVLEMSEREYDEVAPVAIELARAEGLQAHVLNLEGHLARRRESSGGDGGEA
ncbi:MAG: histidinol dehydrogenase [Candidatus Dormibacteria bacterium]